MVSGTGWKEMEWNKIFILLLGYFYGGTVKKKRGVSFNFISQIGGEGKKKSLERYWMEWNGMHFIEFYSTPSFPSYFK